MRVLVLLLILLTSCACNIHQGYEWCLTCSDNGPLLSECATVESISLSHPDPTTVRAEVSYRGELRCIPTLKWTLDGRECWSNPRCWEYWDNGTNLKLHLAPDAGSGLVKACANNVCAEVTI